LVQGNPPGDALYQAKASMAPETDTRLMNYYDFNLYGDPALRLSPIPPPSSVLAEVSYNPIGSDEYEISVRAVNTGGVSDNGGVSISFPSFTDPNDDLEVQLVDTSPDCVYSEYSNGDMIWYRDGYQFPADYLLVESVDDDWQNSEENTLTVRIHPQGDPFEFYVRSAMGYRGYYVNDPPSSAYIDQQGWEVYRYVIVDPSLSFAGISPGSSGTPNTNFEFSITYTDPDDQAPDTIEVVVNGTPHAMSSSDTTYDDGVVFTSSPLTFDIGVYNYYFQATQGAWNGRDPTSGSYQFEVVSAANGLTLSSDTYSIPLDGSSVAHLTAHVTDGQGDPVVGELVTFDTNYTGSLNPRTDTTDANGDAYTTFTPSEVGDAIVYATTDGGLSDQVTIDVYQDSGAVETTFEIRLESQTDTQSQYDIDGDSRYVSSGEPVDHTDIVYTVLGESGQPFGVLESSYYGTQGNPVTDRTDNWGDSSVDLIVTESQLVTIKAEILGSVDTTVAYVQVGPVDPADLQPFITVGFPGEVTDLEMSPFHDALVATSADGRSARVMDPTTYQFVQTLSLADDEEVFSAREHLQRHELRLGTQLPQHLGRDAVLGCGYVAGRRARGCWRARRYLRRLRSASHESLECHQRLPFVHA
jgi:hypothetical protein